MKPTIPLICLACCGPLAGADRDAEPIIMLKISVQHVTSTDDPGFKTGILSPKENAQWLRRAAGREGLVIRALPSVTCRPDQEGTIELIREMITPEFDKSWMGVTVKLRGSLAGDQNRMTADYEHRLLTLYGREETIDPTADAAPFKQKDFERYWAKHKEFPLKTRKVAIDELAPDGFTIVDRTNGTSDKHEFVLVTVQRIDAAGQPVRQRE